jgi:hypothetical protein
MRYDLTVDLHFADQLTVCGVELVRRRDQAASRGHGPFLDDTVEGELPIHQDR